MADIDLTGSLIQSVDPNSGTVAEKKKEREVSSGNSMDKDAFLQLLVAEMKYQDPLQPTSNTDYIAQFAQFSQVESLQNMSDNMDLSRAQGLVGQTVVLSSENAQGETEYITGVVDSVTFEEGVPYLHVNGGSYKMDSLEEVVNAEYLAAQDIIAKLQEGLEKLPEVDYLSVGDQAALENLLNLYNGMSAYQQKFVDAATESKLTQYADQMTTILENLQKILEEAEQEAGNAGKTETEQGSSGASSGSTTSDTKTGDTNVNTGTDAGTAADSASDTSSASDAAAETGAADASSETASDTGEETSGTGTDTDISITDAIADALTTDPDAGDSGSAASEEESSGTEIPEDAI